MIAYVFPGQGSQFVGMGRELFAKYPQWTAQADRILGYSIEDLCVRDARSKLRQTQFTQPAIFVVSALSYLDKRDSGAQAPRYVAGHSVGEISALFAAGVLDFEHGLKLVCARAQLMSQACGGGMVAVLGCDSARIAELLEEHGLGEVDVANYNSPSQVVLSGPLAALARVESALAATGAKVIPLNVSGAFHSRYMKPYGAALAGALDCIPFRPGEIPIIANVTGRPHDAATVRQALVRQLWEPVRWCDTIRYLLAAGVKRFEEIGPNAVLTRLVDATRRHDAQTPSSRTDALQVRPAERACSAQSSCLGSEAFRRDYGVRRAYVAGGMYKGIASVAMVVRMARAGYLAFFGAGGVRPAIIEESIRRIRRELARGETFGVNLLSTPDDPAGEMATVELFVRESVGAVEAAGYTTLSPAIVRYRLAGLSRDESGAIHTGHKVLAKLSRPEVAAAFLSPPPPNMVAELLNRGLVSEQQARLGAQVPMADDLCVEADSAGHTDMGVTAVLLPTIIRLRNALCRRHGYTAPVRVGSSGGIGTPEAAASAFVLGADFILTGSINQCTVEAGTSDAVKEMLQHARVQDTGYAPAGDLFELGSRIQVLTKGVFFPARSNRLYDLWRNFDSWVQIDRDMRTRIERDYFGRSFESVYEETRRHYLQRAPAQIDRAERDPKHKLALVFRWYFIHTMRLALSGAGEHRVNFQIHCGPAMGAFNEWVKSTEIESWQARHVDEIADKLMAGTAELLSASSRRFAHVSG